MSAVPDAKPIYPKIVAEVETITPAKARQYLATMVQNRNVSDAKVIEYALKLEQGDVVLNGETIKFDCYGHLIDGQHRLRGCDLAEKPFQSVVVRGISDPRAMATIDTGKSRSNVDVWTIAGHPNAALASGIASIIYFYEHNRCTWKGVTGRRVPRTSHVAQKLKTMPTAASNIGREELLKFAEPIMEALQESARFASKCRAKTVVHPTAVGALHYLATKKGQREQVERFLDDVGHGVGLEKGDPAYTLREHVIARMRTGTRLSRYYVFGALIKAFNARLEGKPMRVIKVMAGEEFPRVK